MQQKYVKLKHLAIDPQTLLALADGTVCFIITRFFFVACMGDGRRGDLLFLTILFFTWFPVFFLLMMSV